MIGRGIAILAAAATLVAGTGIADAATVAKQTTYRNFQITVRTRYSDSIWFCGDNQYGNFVCSPTIDSSKEWTLLKNWWWKGGTAVSVQGFQDSTGIIREKYCTPPMSSTTSNIYKCDAYDKL
ncbi:hypothetical protein AB0J71_47865 [Nonomuraea sp. NPDC049637]|uniref:hypothetical protein n=1 Tax=Nonomuraea sp. NPDC049637 TaxID=3154356 RepID=UPI0034434D47